MKSGKHQVGWRTPMPGATHRRHETPRAGDTLSAIERCGAEPGDHIHCLDWNMTAVRVRSGAGKFYHLPISGHWFSRLDWNGFTHTAQGHRLTAKELRMSFDQYARSRGYRAQAVFDLRKPDGTGPLPWSTAVDHAKEHGVVLTPDLKSPRFRRAVVAARMAGVCEARDYPLWTMALLNLPWCRSKCKAIRGAGGQFAIIFGGLRPKKPKAWAAWRPKPNQIWGPKSAKAWLR